MTSEGTNTDDVTVVVDVGSRWLRGGLAGEDAPRCELPCVVTASSDKSGTSQYIGEDALSNRSRTKLRYPVHRGGVEDWSVVEALLGEVYSSLHVQSDSRHTLLLTRPVHSSQADAERLVQTAIENLGASGVYLARQPILTLYANGRTQGVVVASGEGVTQVVPVYEGFAIPHAIQRQDLAGTDVTTALQDALLNRRPGSVHVDLETAREMKEKLCYLNYDPDVDVDDRQLKRGYKLPNGDVITVGPERFQSPEVLFQPSLIDSESLGLPALVIKSVSACPIDIRRHLYDKVMMAGGTTLMPGICRRLLKELSNLAPTAHVKIVAPARRQHSAWCGGSILASLSTFPQLCVSKADYEEHGNGILREKFQ